MTEAPPPQLSVRDIVVRFGGIVALDGIRFDIRRGEILGLIGPNGAGKTTLFNCLSRLYTPASGDILYDGRSILRRPAHRMPAAGIGRTFQNVALFHRHTVRDNLRIGAHSGSRGNFVSDALGLPGVRRREREIDAKVAEIIEYLGLGDVADQMVSGLPFGTQKRVELGRALASGPGLILLDEPAGGLNHDEVADLGRLIRQMRDDRGITVLLVEHHMGLVMSVSDTVVVLNFGRKIAEGPPATVRKEQAVIDAYLGGTSH